MNDNQTHAGLFAGPALVPEGASAQGLPEGSAQEPPVPNALGVTEVAAAPGAEAGAAADAAPATPAAAAAPADGFGPMLRAARERAGVSVPALAQRLRLHVKQIDALERGDLAALPGLIYVRGFLRSCARELGIDAAPLLADLDQRAGLQPGLPMPSGPGALRLSRFGDGSRLLIVSGLALLLVAGLVGVWMPRRSAPPSPPVVIAPPPPSAAPEASAPAAPAPAAGEAPAPADLPRPAPAPGPAAPARAPGSAVRGAATTAAAEAAPVAMVGAAEAPVLAALAPPVDPNALVLSVHATSWVEVAQANGATVFSQICLPGSEHTIRGVPPLRVVIGNAASVEAKFRGAPVDLPAHANANGVARLVLQ